MRNLLPIRAGAVAALAGALLAGQAGAQDVGKDDILRQLAPPLTRSLAPPAPSRKIMVVPGQQEQVLADTKALPTVAIRVMFDYNSDVLTPTGQASLKPLGEALADPRLKESRLLIGGHTDGRGSEDYNQSLSERRARSVREYLVLTHKIDPERISAMGFGKRKLVNVDDPENAANRRVEIVNLGR